MTISLEKNTKQRESVRIAGPQLTQLRQLTDVNLSGLSNGDAIVYDANTDTFVVRSISATGLANDSLPYLILTDSPFASDFEPEVYFQKANYANNHYDHVDTNVEIARGNQGGLYNPLVEPDYDSSPNGPSYTLWESEKGWADLTDLKYRNYTSWADAVNYYPTGWLNKELIMWDTYNDQYYAVKFLSWQFGVNNGGAGGGGFSYIRKKIVKQNFFKRLPNSALANSVDQIATGLSLRRANNGGALFNPAAGQTSYQGNNDNLYPANTRWNADGWSNVSLSNLQSRQWLSFVAASGKYAFDYVYNKEFVMHDTSNDKYYAIKFTDWGQNNGGSWAYHRRLISPETSYGIKFSDGTIFTPDKIPSIGNYKFKDHIMSVPTTDMWIVDENQNGLTAISNSYVQMFWAEQIQAQDQYWNGSSSGIYVNSDGVYISTYNNDYYSWRFNPYTGRFESPAILTMDGVNIRFYTDSYWLSPPSTSNYKGNRISLWDTSSSNAYSYAIGMETNNMWFGVDGGSSTEGFKWYKENEEIMRLERAGNLNISGSINASSYLINGEPIAVDLGPAYDYANTIIGNGYISDLYDVDINYGSIQIGYVLKWNGDDWVADDLANGTTFLANTSNAVFTSGYLGIGNTPYVISSNYTGVTIGGQGYDADLTLFHSSGGLGSRTTTNGGTSTSLDIWGEFAIGTRSVGTEYNENNSSLLLQFNHGNKNFAFWTASNYGFSSPKVAIFDSGNVIIGRSVAESDIGRGVKLDVDGAVNASAVIVTNSITPGPFTVATLPTTSPAGQIIFVSDDSGGPTLAFSNGTHWLKLTAGGTVS